MHNRLKEKINLAPHDALLVLTNHKTGEVRKIWGRNIITHAGDIYYAQSAAGEAVTNDFNSLYLATAGPAADKGDDYGDFTVVAGSEQAVENLYPRTNDPDADNTGAGVNIVTWLFEYGTADGPFVNITHSFISITGAGGTDPILNSYEWAAAWDKDEFTSATIFSNHEFEGT